MSFASFAPQQRRRFLPQGFMPPSGAQPMGPDIQADDSALAQQMNRPVIYEQDSGIGAALGNLGASLMKTRSAGSNLQPDGSSPYDSLPQATSGPLKPGAHKFLGLFARGGVLRKPGDVAVVGDEGPEVASVGDDGTTRITPLVDPSEKPKPRFLSRVMAAVQPDTQDTQGSAPPSLPRTLSAVRQNFSGDQQAGPYVPSDDSPPPPGGATRPRQVFPGTPDAQLPSANTEKIRAAVNSLYGDPSKNMVQNPDYYGQNIDAPVSLNAQGQSVAGDSTRPRWADRLDQLATERAATQDALAHPETLPKAHGLKRALPIIAGFLQGAGRDPYSPLAAGIGGAAAGAVGTAADPRLATREGFSRPVPSRLTSRRCSRGCWAWKLRRLPPR